MEDKSRGKYSISELLTLPNHQILGKWSTLASLIRLHEYPNHPEDVWGNVWHPSREKAIYLLKSETAEDYLNDVREHHANVKRIVEPIETKDEEPIEELVTNAQFVEEVETEKSNYDLFIELLPEFEERLIKEESLYAVSDVLGYRGVVSIAPINFKADTALVAIRHFVPSGKGFELETDFRIRVDVPAMAVQCITQGCNSSYKKAIHFKDGIELVDEAERGRQKELLTNFLKHLIDNKHIFFWVEDRSPEYRRFFCNVYYDAEEYDEDDYLDPKSLTQYSQDQLEAIIFELNEKNQALEDRIAKFEKRRRKKKERKKEKRRLEVQTKFLQSAKEEAIQNLIDNINDFIPVSPVGYVEMLEEYRMLGVSEEDIDDLNEFQNTIHFFPKKGSKMRGFKLMPNGRIEFDANKGDNQKSRA
ncbi:MAG: hypothetical protein ACFHU9_09125 [Fluviicola sp.]